MPNALMPDTSSYADPVGNALLAKGWDATQAYAPIKQAQDVAMNQQVMQLRQAQLSQEQLKLGQQKLSALNGVLGALVTNPTPDNFTSQLGWAVQSGVIDPQSASKASQEVAALAGDPAKIKQWATDHLNQNAQHQQLMDQAYGTPGMISNGAVSSPTMVRSGAGGGYFPATGPSVVQQMGPGDAGSQVAASPDPLTGAPRVQTKGAYVAGQGRTATVDPFGRIAYGGAPASPATPPAGQPPAQAPAGQGAPPVPAGGAPPAAAARGTGAPIDPNNPTLPPGPVTDTQYQAALHMVGQMQNMDPRRMTLQQQRYATLATEIVSRYQQQGSGGGAPAAPNPPPGGAPSQPGQPAAPVLASGAGQGAAGPGPMVVGLPPGVVEGRTAMAATNAKAVTDLQSAADTVPQQNAAIDNLSAQLGKISTGPLASKINAGKATYNQIAQMTGLPQVDPQGVAAMEEFHKSAAQLAGASMAALGGAGTNDKLGLALAQNPNDTLSNMGNAQVIPLLKGLNAAITVKNEAQQRYLQAHGGDPSSIGAFQADWNRTFSPRAFQFAYMTPAQRQDLFASMSPGERQQLVGAVQTAEQRGWINAGVGK